MACLSPTYSNCIIFTTELKAELKKKGFSSTNLEEFLIELVSKESLAGKVQALETAVSGISAGTLQAGAKTYGLKSGSAIKLTNRSVDYSIDNQELVYDFSRLLNELPEGVVYLGARVDVVDANGKRAASIKGKRNVLPITTQSTINFALELKDADGTFSLERSVLAGEGSKSALLNVRDFTTGAGDLTVTEHLEALSSEVALLKTRI